MDAHDLGIVPALLDPCERELHRRQVRNENDVVAGDRIEDALPDAIEQGIARGEDNRFFFSITLSYVSNKCWNIVVEDQFFIGPLREVTQVSTSAREDRSSRDVVRCFRR